MVASDFKPLGGDWTGTNGSAFGVASGNFAGDGANGWLTGVNFVSGSINERKGLTVYSDTLFTGGPEAALVITDLILDQEAGTIMLTFDSKPGRTYAVQRSFDLVTFDTIETGVASLGGSSVATDIVESRWIYVHQLASQGHTIRLVAPYNGVPGQRKVKREVGEHLGFGSLFDRA